MPDKISLLLEHCSRISGSAFCSSLRFNQLYNLRENEYKLAVPQPRTEFYKRSLSYSGSVLWNGLPLEVRQLTSPSIFKGKLRDKFRLTNNLISDILFLHTASLKSRCFLFISIILVFILYFRLVRKLVFLYLNVNVPDGNTVYK